MTPLWLVLIMWVMAGEWLHAAWDKFMQPGFLSGMSKTLQTFADHTAYSSYGAYLRSSVIPQAEVFGNLIRYGEILVGLGLLLGGIWWLAKGSISGVIKAAVVLALLGGILMNVNYYLATSWSGPAAQGVNIVMALVQIVILLSLVVPLPSKMDK